MATRVVGSVTAAVLSATLLLVTSRSLPMTWDEANAILRALVLVEWTELWGQENTQPLEADTIAQYWQYTTVFEGHPAFYAMVISTGVWLAPPMSPLDCGRFGPIVLFAVASGALFYRLDKQYSLMAAGCAVLAMLLLPRLFAHAHFAFVDSPLTSCWVLAWATFAPATKDWRFAVPWGVTLGMAMSCKATGWITPLPFIVWVGIYRDRIAIRSLMIGLILALATFVALNPPLWHSPIAGVQTFLQLNARREYNVPTVFLGQDYDLYHPLPWYNTLFWIGVTVPLGTLLLVCCGVWAILRNGFRDAAGILVLGHWLILVVVRALPMAPPHDGIRLFLPSFPFLAVVAGVGANWLARNAAGKLVRWRTTAIALLMLGSASSWYWYQPHGLSYYNLLIGGLPGAVRRGMEPTYYWDGLDRSVTDWLARNTRYDEKVKFTALPEENLSLMRSFGLLDVEYRAEAPGRYRWYVLQRRPSTLSAADRWLIRHHDAAFQKRIRPNGWGPWRLDTPLVEVYAFEQHLESLAAVQ